jgi:sirohydrochlorin ferrochelatase
MPALIAVAHGSRDPRSAAAVMELLAVTRSLRPGLEIRGAFLDLSAPRLGDVLRALHGEGHDEVTVVPLLLGSAYHARVDVPAMVGEACARLPRLSVEVSAVLGPDRRLETLARNRLLETGVSLDDPGLGVVLAAAGSSHRPANTAVSTVASRWAARYSWAGAVAAFAAAADPNVPAAINRLRAMGASRIAVASWFLAPGLLPDRIATQAREVDPNVLVADPLGADVTLAELILDRYDEALTSANAVLYA